MYPLYQDYFRRRQPKLLAVWHRHDPVFASEGAEAFRRDLRAARILLLETGHFAIETVGGKVADEIKNFFLD